VTVSFSFSCGDVLPGCAAHFDADTTDDLMTQVATHAADDHGITDLTPDVIETVQSKITSH
jgi:predicted small metal-binding protein